LPELLHYLYVLHRDLHSFPTRRSSDLLRALINCSEPVRHESHVAFLERYRPYGLDERALHTCYAMAENTFAVTQSDLDRPPTLRSEEHTSELQSRENLVCRLLLEKKKT